MPKHPCADGLTAACFAAYPKWARQALAYKILHILLPKPLTARLPGGLNTGLAAPGVVLPPGIVLPPGYIIPPGVVFPPGWTPGDPPPEGGIPPPVVSPIPPGTGPAPPIYVSPWEPGPVHRPGPSAPPSEAEPSLLASQNQANYGLNLGRPGGFYKLAGRINDDLSAFITTIALGIGRTGNPTDNVILEIWEAAANGLPSVLLSGGEATPLEGSSIPVLSFPIGLVEFQFPDNPVLSSGVPYAVVAYRSGSANSNKYYTVGYCFPSPTTIWNTDYSGDWYEHANCHFALEVYGVLK